MITIEGREILTTLEELVDPKYTALLLIDVQNDFCSPGGYFDKTGLDMAMLQRIPSRVKPVLEAARLCGVSIVHIRHTYYPNHLAESGAWLRMRYNSRKARGIGRGEYSTLLGGTMDGTWGWQEVDEVAPRPGESVIKKHRSSAFVGTGLDVILRSNGIRSVVSVGVVTEGCVESTAREAQFRDYYSVLLRDCVATTTPEVHEAALLIMSRRLDVVDSSEVMAIWAKREAGLSPAEH